jgi:hypothetical protein
VDETAAQEGKEEKVKAERIKQGSGRKPRRMGAM